MGSPRERVPARRGRVGRHVPCRPVDRPRQPPTRRQASPASLRGERQAMTPEQAKALRDIFPEEQIGKLPATQGRPELDYVGHAAVTSRLLAVDPEWTW